MWSNSGTESVWLPGIVHTPVQNHLKGVAASSSVSYASAYVATSSAAPSSRSHSLPFPLFLIAFLPFFLNNFEKWKC